MTSKETQAAGEELLPFAWCLVNKAGAAISWYSDERVADIEQQRFWPNTMKTPLYRHQPNDKHHIGDANEMISALEADNKRLRKALEEVNNWGLALPVVPQGFDEQRRVWSVMHEALSTGKRDV